MDEDTAAEGFGSDGKIFTRVSVHEQYPLELWFVSESRIRLYVKGAKTVTGTFQGWQVKGWGRAPDWDEEEPEYEFVLSENQQKTVDLVRELARKHSLEVEVVDVTKESFLRRLIQKAQGKVKIFPTLIASSGHKIEGDMTVKQVESLFSSISEEKRKRYF